MKKSILLLTAAALLSLGTLTGCPNNAPSEEPSSSEVDPEANWPVHEWSEEEKAFISARFGTEFDFPSLLPFYYIEGQTLKNYTRCLSIEAPAGKGSVADAQAYERKLIAAGFDQCADSTSEEVHYRKFLKQNYARISYFDVTAYMYEGAFAIDVLVGEEVNDHSFAGRDVDPDDFPSTLAGVVDAAKKYFAGYGLTEEYELSFPTSIGESNVVQIDFIDYYAEMARAYYAKYGAPYNYINVLETALKADFSNPIGRITFTTSDKTPEDLADDVAVVDTALDGASYSIVTNYKADSTNNTNVASTVRRNAIGYEVSLDSSDYDDGTGQNSGHPGYIYADISYEYVHDYSGSFYGKKTEAKPNAYIEAGQLMTDYIRNVLQSTGKTTSVGFWDEWSGERTLSATVTDLRYYYVTTQGVDIGPAVQIAATGWLTSDEEIQHYFVEKCGWVYHAATEEEPTAYFTFGDWKAVAKLSGTSTKKVTIQIRLAGE